MVELYSDKGITMERTAKLVCFGRGGDSVEYGNGCRGSGYGTPERPHASAGCIIPDGTPAIDKRPAIETDEGFNWVFKGPMCNPDLVDDEVTECPEPSGALVAGVSGNQYGALLTLQHAHKAVSRTPGPLDFVSIRQYVEGWRRVGARIGHYENGVIVWHD